MFMYLEGTDIEIYHLLVHSLMPRSGQDSARSEPGAGISLVLGDRNSAA